MSVAVFQLDALGVDPRVASLLTDTIVSELSKIPDTKVISSKDIDVMLNYEQKKQMAGCTDTSCAVAIGGALGVDKLVLGNVGKLGDTHVLNLRLLDIRTATVDSVYSKQLEAGSEDRFLKVLPDALTVLFPWGDSLWHRPADRTLSAGKIDSGAVPTVETKQVVSAEKPRYWLYSMISYGAGVAFGVTGLALGLVAGGEQNQLQEIDTARTRAQADDLKSGYENKALAADVLFGATAAAAVTGSVFMFLHLRESKRFVVPGAEVKPVVTPGGMGIEGTW
ncbi:MAG: hypothetical protein HY897_09955 [Deltaproteobacteria bacterium]|nr:hypothetical protein [Deltaproteobacteria bacterium]